MGNHSKEVIVMSDLRTPSPTCKIFPSYIATPLEELAARYRAAGKGREGDMIREECIKNARHVINGVHRSQRAELMQAWLDQMWD